MGRSAEGAAQRQAAAAERASQRQAAAAERAARRAQAAAVSGAKAQEREQARATRAAEVGAQRAAMAYVRAEEQKRRAARTSAEARERAEREATSVARTEAAKRNLTADQEARVKQQTLERLTRVYETEERRRTAAAKREQREREREARRTERTAETERRGVASTISQGVTAAAGAAGGFASTSHGLIQGARQSRAQADRTIGDAVRNSGGSARDVAAARDAVRRFVGDTGIGYDTVAGALSLGQGRGSALEADEGTTRGQALTNALTTIRMANAEGIDAGQLLAARGRLGAAGLRGASLDEAVRMTIGAAQRGSVEVEQIITEGLPGASRLMSQRIGALPPNATEAQRQRTALNAYRESVAMQEVAASTGRRAGNAANVLSAVNNALQTPRRQEQILTNIDTAASSANVHNEEGRRRREALLRFREEMFERDPTRSGNAMRLREGVTPLSFSARLAEVTGGNAAAAANILAGSGHGNPQSFQANWRDLVAFLGGRTATGETGAQRVNAMMGATVDTATIAEHQRDVESDDLSNLTRAQEAGTNALTNNTDAVNKLSNRFADWAAANPLHSTAATIGGTFLASTVGPALANRIGSWASGTRIGQMLGPGGGGVRGLLSAARGGASGLAARVGARGLLGRVGGAVFGVPGLLSEGLSAIGAYGGTSQDDVERQRREGAEWERQSTRLSGEARAAGRAPPTAAEIGAAVAAALRASPLTATVAPTDAAQAASRAPAPGR